MGKMAKVSVLNGYGLYPFMVAILDFLGYFTYLQRKGRYRTVIYTLINTLCFFQTCKKAEKIEFEIDFTKREKPYNQPRNGLKQGVKRQP